MPDDKLKKTTLYWRERARQMRERKKFMDRTYKIEAPLGTLILPKDVMTEKEIREYLPQLVADPEMHEIWKEKAAKDPIADILLLLMDAGFKVEPQ